MDNRQIAAELIRLAKSIHTSNKCAADPQSVLDELKSIEVRNAEGPMVGGISSLEGKKFKSVRDLEKALAKFPYPEKGYYKVHLLLTLKDGTQLKGFRYDHGERDDRLNKQLDNYIERYVTVASNNSRVSTDLFSVILFDDLQSGKGRVIETDASVKAFDKLARSMGFRKKSRDSSLVGYYYINDDGDVLQTGSNIYSEGDLVDM